MATTARKTPVPKQGGLRSYEAKRDFARTPEPKPGDRAPEGLGLRFVVQRHDARRLHFDLRLEWDGVLKSWAVTKGPSMVAGVRRLAVETEDHPIGYLDWEGNIPKGQYGGGTMIVWDTGLWEPEGDAAKGLKMGKLSFQLAGSRLKGKWSLVRMASEGKAKKQNWLLIKSRDAYALKPGGEEPVDTELTSVKTGRANAALATRPDHKARLATARRGVAATATLSRVAGAKKGILPPFVDPSLAELSDRPPDGPDWIHEVKHDGYRIQARVEGGKVQLLTRKGLDWTARFPRVADAAASLAVGAALLDGEIIVPDDSGQSSFSDLQRDLKAKRHDRLVYYVFDLLHCNGVDLRGAALAERKHILQEVISASPASSVIRFNEHLEAEGDAILREACKLGLEGIVSKREDAPYVSGRGEHWIKSKCALRQEFVVLGYVRSAAAGKGIGSLVLGYYQDGALMHAGRVGTGFDDAQTRQLKKKLDAAKTGKPQFGNAVTKMSLRGVVWSEPQRVAEVAFRGWSSDGLLRQASFKGLREDKPPREVKLERAKPSPAETPAPSVSGAVPKVSLTHPDRLLWTDPDVTKRDLADYYSEIAEWILPQITGRVLSLKRCPDGAAGQCFFAKHAWMGADDSVKLIDIGSEKPMLAVEDLRGLLSLVQMNVLEIHVWGSRLAHLEYPDRMVFDLDPGEDVPQLQVCEAAREVHDRLRRLGLTSFLKSTGGKGLHVVVPLEPKAGWDDVKSFSKAFADVMAEDDPKRYVATLSKAKRNGRVFVDYLRNGRGATAIASYSTRARPHAPVAVPLDWMEIGKTFPVFDINQTMRRLKNQKSDPWRDMEKVRQTLPKLR